MSEQELKRLQIAIDSAIKFRVLALTDDTFLKFISDAEMRPSPEALAAVERFNREMVEYLSKRAAQVQPQAAVQQPQQSPATESFQKQYVN
jgi:hypothetical protein